MSVGWPHSEAGTPRPRPEHLIDRDVRSTWSPPPWRARIDRKDDDD